MNISVKKIIGGLALTGVLLSQAQARVECHNPEGVYSMMASLASRLMTETHRLQPLTDFKVENWYLALTDEAIARCNGRCGSTQAVLDFQKPEVNNYIDPSIFNANTYRERLLTLFQRQVTASNRPETDPNRAYVEPHDLVLWQVLQFEDACGDHSMYSLDAEDGVFDKKEQMCTNLIWAGAQGTVSTDRCIADNPYLDIRFKTMEDGTEMLYMDPLISLVKTADDDGISQVNSCLLIDESNTSTNRSCSCNSKVGKLLKMDGFESSYYCKTN